MKTKLILLIFTTLFFTNSYSQDDYTRVKKGICQVDHKCRLEYKTDDFEESTTYKIGFYETNIAEKVVLSYILYRIDKKDGENPILMTFFGEKEGCITESSYVYFIFKDGEKLKIPSFSKEIDCGRSTITIMLNDYLDVFTEKEIDKIRLNIEFADDFNVSKKGQKKFFGNLNCIKNTVIE
jgi:hypothetical protein